MRKIVPIAVLCLLFLCGIVYIVIGYSSKASNNLYEYEYDYSNEMDEVKDIPVMKYQTRRKKTKEEPVFNPDDITEIDREPNSITVFVNKELGLPEDYIPEDLVVPDILFQINYFDEKKMLRQEAADAIEDLFKDSKKAGLSLYGISGYRSYKRQNQIYTTNVRTKGEEYTNRYSAKPGHSEHQTGLVMDVSTPSIGNRLEPVFAGTPEGKWLAVNAHQYGFIIRYPKDKENITGYSYEPWHIRYVGVSMAKYIYENDLTLEELYHYTPSQEYLDQEYIYDNFTDVDESEEKIELEPYIESEEELPEATEEVPLEEEEESDEPSQEQPPSQDMEQPADEAETPSDPPPIEQSPDSSTANETSETPPSTDSKPPKEETELEAELEAAESEAEAEPVVEEELELEGFIEE